MRPSEARSVGRGFVTLDTAGSSSTWAAAGGGIGRQCDSTCRAPPWPRARRAHRPVADALVPNGLVGESPSGRPRRRSKPIGMPIFSEATASRSGNAGIRRAVDARARRVDWPSGRGVHARRHGASRRLGRRRGSDGLTALHLDHPAFQQAPSQQRRWHVHGHHRRRQLNVLDGTSQRCGWTSTTTATGPDARRAQRSAAVHERRQGAVRQCAESRSSSRNRLAARDVGGGGRLRPRQVRGHLCAYSI